MNRHVSTGALCLLALGLAAPASAQVPLQPKELVHRLREGGYVIFTLPSLDTYDVVVLR